MEDHSAQACRALHRSDIPTTCRVLDRLQWRSDYRPWFQSNVRVDPLADPASRPSRYAAQIQMPRQPSPHLEPEKPQRFLRCSLLPTRIFQICRTRYSRGQLPSMPLRSNTATCQSSDPPQTRLPIRWLCLCTCQVRSPHKENAGSGQPPGTTDSLFASQVPAKSTARNSHRTDKRISPCCQLACHLRL